MVTTYTIYNEGKNKNWLTKDGLRFFDTRENIFSYFKGYYYKLLESVNNDKIEPFLYHVKEVIANGNDEVY